MTLEERRQGSQVDFFLSLLPLAMVQSLSQVYLHRGAPACNYNKEAAHHFKSSDLPLVHLVNRNDLKVFGTFLRFPTTSGILHASNRSLHSRMTVIRGSPLIPYGSLTMSTQQGAIS
ncbi:hypothetical protein B0H66DRAFT_268116 [Apodospora peruviana]|uniref:Uncharacterized protein n=1 Tax=Apodospora peruviana TaxID=516989 RepID=A0AAE0M5F8_9PEZI|nr:hypothetical protein B0H66DRAFT_268116 [Apodospora peruviana]